MILPSDLTKKLKKLDNVNVKSLFAGVTALTILFGGVGCTNKTEDNAVPNNASESEDIISDTTQEKIIENNGTSLNAADSENNSDPEAELSMGSEDETASVTDIIGEVTADSESESEDGLKKDDNSKYVAESVSEDNGNVGADISDNSENSGEDGNTEVSDDAAETEESDNKNSKKPFSEVIDITEYDSCGMANAGALPISNKKKWGAINYDGEVIVPVIYDSIYASPNNIGSFILTKGKNYYLFDNKGNLIYEGNKPVTATGNVYSMYSCDSDGKNGKVTYYAYDGSVILETARLETTDFKEYSSTDGKVMLFQSYKDDSNTVEQIGFLDHRGNVEWLGDVYNGPSSGKTDDGQLLTGQVFSGNSTTSWVHVGSSPVSAMNKGYFVNFNPYIEAGELDLYNDKLELVSRTNIDYVSPDGEGGLNYGPDQHIEGPESGFGYYYYDGARNYNVGSRMVWFIKGKNYLVDLSKSGTDINTMPPETVLASYESIYMKDEKYWLVYSGKKWGYCNQDGELINQYDDASDFVDGIALIIKNGKAYFIDEEFNELQTIDGAIGVSACGELFKVRTLNSIKLYKRN